MTCMLLSGSFINSMFRFVSGLRIWNQTGIRFGLLAAFFPAFAPLLVFLALPLNHRAIGTFA